MSNMLELLFNGILQFFEHIVSDFLFIEGELSCCRVEADNQRLHDILVGFPLLVGPPVKSLSIWV